MKPVMQTIFPSDDNPLRGNCFAACIASLLEMSLEDVPHLTEHDDWRERTNDWLGGLGLGMVEVFLDTTEAALHALPSEMWVIVSGPATPLHQIGSVILCGSGALLRGGGARLLLPSSTDRHHKLMHTVVAKTLPGGCLWEYRHDPYPGGNFLTRGTHLMWLAALDPLDALRPSSRGPTEFPWKERIMSDKVSDSAATLPCPQCNGTGDKLYYEPGLLISWCGPCKGTGRVPAPLVPVEGGG